MFENIRNKLKANSELLEEALSQYYNYSDNDFNDLIEAQKYGILNGGKRIRAFLVIEISKLFGGNIDSALPYACAIEMIHASSLIHDDMPCIDNDDFRRGKPSTHKAYGEAIALFAGDAMMAKAFATIVQNPFLEASINAKAVEVLASATGDSGMLAGQAIDVFAANNKLNKETLTRLHTLKTGKLIVASAILGCLSAGVDVSDERCLASVKYAESVGLAFQIIDDLLDYEEGKRELNSFLTFMSVDEAKKYAAELTETGINAIKLYDTATLTELALYLTERKY